MTPRPIAIVALFAPVLLLLGDVSAVVSASRTTDPTPSYVEGEVLVKFRSPATAAVARSAVAVRGHTVVASAMQSSWAQVKIADTQSVPEALAAYRSDPGVEYVQPNYVYRADALPNDSRFAQLWALKNSGQPIGTGSYFPDAGTPGADLNVEKAWDHVTDCASVVVAVIDSGVNYDHEDLAANMWNGGATFPRHGADFVDKDNDPMDTIGHGTHVAGTIGAAGNNGTGVAGVCWKASIMAVRVLDADGRGTTATLLQGIDFAVSQGAKVINMSLGGPSFDPLLNEAIAQAQANDVVLVVSAGNEGLNIDLAGREHYPCGYGHDNLICVTALDQTYARATFANFGVESVDVGAPGTNILSAQALQERTISDDFNTAGALDWTSSGGWAYRPLSLKDSPIDVLANPPTFPSASGEYANNADERAYKTFDLGGAISATLRFTVQRSLQPGDSLTVNYRNGAADPFADGVLLERFTGTLSGVRGPFSYGISACAGGPCSIGFQLSTDASGTAPGVGIASFSIEANELTNVAYRARNGTSMAAPQVAGVAAMLRAYNPQFTYVDVVNAIKNGGRPIAALAGRTTTGRAADAMSSLAYINAPTGLSATITR